MVSTISKDKIDSLLKEHLSNNRNYRELLVQLLQLSSYKVSSLEYVKLLAVYSDKRFMREVRKIVK